MLLEGSVCELVELPLFFDRSVWAVELRRQVKGSDDQLVFFFCLSLSVFHGSALVFPWFA